ncbi:hypothetical protein QFC22_002625 [Naganishia vaughanmartiniae]|uniref:Uncharacterized protein n=1 Tax=Naganishia vaughanmartiniae TaxID=1424756 RepID=A0ACC2XB93_9TREE|nr:hypothetical protein QFC22_002625 [Naganishia vaughanmartiniae]
MPMCAVKPYHRNEYPLTLCFDFAIAHQWQDIRLSDLKQQGWVVLFGRKAMSDPIRLILPLAININSLTPEALQSIFSALQALKVDTLPQTLPPLVEIPKSGFEADDTEDSKLGEATLDKETIYISITTPDSSVVYYKLTKGIKKPQDVPDE